MFFFLVFSLGLFGWRFVSIHVSWKIPVRLYFTFKISQWFLIIWISFVRVLLNVVKREKWFIFTFAFRFRIFYLGVDMTFSFQYTYWDIAALRSLVYRFVYTAHCRLCRFFSLIAWELKSYLWDMWGEMICNGDNCVLVGFPRSVFCSFLFMSAYTKIVC